MKHCPNGRVHDWRAVKNFRATTYIFTAARFTVADLTERLNCRPHPPPRAVRRQLLQPVGVLLDGVGELRQLRRRGVADVDLIVRPASR
jgi:hypothetical protein